MNKDETCLQFKMKKHYIKTRRKKKRPLTAIGHHLTATSLLSTPQFHSLLLHHLQLRGLLHLHHSLIYSSSHLTHLIYSLLSGIIWFCSWRYFLCRSSLASRVSLPPPPPKSSRVTGCRRAGEERLNRLEPSVSYVRMGILLVMYHSHYYHRRLFS